MCSQHWFNIQVILQAVWTYGSFASPEKKTVCIESRRCGTGFCCRYPSQNGGFFFQKHFCITVCACVRLCSAFSSRIAVFPGCKCSSRCCESWPQASGPGQSAVLSYVLDSALAVRAAGGAGAAGPACLLPWEVGADQKHSVWCRGGLWGQREGEMGFSLSNKGLLSARFMFRALWQVTESSRVLPDVEEKNTHTRLSAPLSTLRSFEGWELSCSHSCQCLLGTFCPVWYWVAELMEMSPLWEAVAEAKWLLGMHTVLLSGSTPAVFLLAVPQALGAVSCEGYQP